MKLILMIKVEPGIHKKAVEEIKKNSEIKDVTQIMGLYDFVAEAEAEDIGKIKESIGRINGVTVVDISVKI